MKYNNNKNLPSINTEIDIPNNSTSGFWLSTAQGEKKKKKRIRKVRKKGKEKKGYFFFHLQNIQRHPAKVFF